MPHITLEYSRNLQIKDQDITELVRTLHHALDGMHNVKLDRVKTRAVPLDFFCVGDRQESGTMIHITLRLFGGRTTAQKKEMALCLQSLARSFCETATNSHPLITVETVEIDRDTYCDDTSST